MFIKPFLNLCQVFALVSFSASLTKNGVHVFVLARFHSLPLKNFSSFVRFCFFSFFLISLIFRLWYCCSIYKVLGFIQLNCPWHSKHSHFPLKLSCWCSRVLMMTLVLPIYRVLQTQSNWKAHGKLSFLAQEIEFLINVFAENWHRIAVLEKITKEYMNNITSVKEKENIDKIEDDKIVKLPWVPKLGPKLRKEFKISSIKTIFSLRRNLKNLHQNHFSFET